MKLSKHDRENIAFHLKQAALSAGMTLFEVPLDKDGERICLDQSYYDKRGNRFVVVGFRLSGIVATECTRTKLCKYKSADELSRRMPDIEQEENTVDETKQPISDYELWEQHQEDLMDAKRNGDFE